MARHRGCTQGPVQVRGRVLHVLLCARTLLPGYALAQQVRRPRPEAGIGGARIRTNVRLCVSERLDPPLPPPPDTVEGHPERRLLCAEESTNIVVVKVDRRQA